MGIQSTNLLFTLGEALEKMPSMKLPPPLEYIRTRKTYVNRVCTVKKPIDFLNLESILEALRVNISIKLNRILDARAASSAEQIDFVNSLYAQDLINLCFVNIRFTSFMCFKTALES
jgi:hypothetical protein